MHYISITMQTANVETHLQCQCSDGLSQPTPSSTGIEDILSKSPDTSLTPLEEHITTSLVRRQMHSASASDLGGSPVLQVITGGQVHVHHIWIIDYTYLVTFKNVNG